MIGSSRHPLAIGLASALWLAAGFAPAWAQETDHASHHPEAKPAPAATPSSPEPVDPHAGHQPTPTDTMSDDHGAMDHGSMKHGQAGHMGHGAPTAPAEPDHSGHGPKAPAPAAPAEPEHSGHGAAEKKPSADSETMHPNMREQPEAPR